MRIRRGRRAVTTLLALWVALGGTASAALAAPGADAPTASSAAVSGAASCARSISCGSGCTAKLSTGFCVQAVDWYGAVEIGGIQIGPGIKVTCDVCECWYIYTSASGNRVFKRTTALSCSAGSPDVEMHVE